MGTVATRQPSGTEMIPVIALLTCLLYSASALPSKLNSVGHADHHAEHHGHHDEDVAASRTVESYLSPVEYEDEEVAASRVVDSYLIPVVEYDEEPAASQAVDSYLVPDELPAAQEPVRTFAKAPVVTKTLDSYFGPPVDREAAPTEAKAYYAIPQADVLQPQPSIARKIKVVAPTAAPVAILRSANTGPQDGNYAYSFETENGISQSVEGRMKMVDETPVYVMKGEYEYPGADGQMWKGTLMRLGIIPQHPSCQRMSFQTTQRLQPQLKPSFGSPRRRRRWLRPSTRSTFSQRMMVWLAMGLKRTCCSQAMATRGRPWSPTAQAIGDSRITNVRHFWDHSNILGQF